MLLSADGCNQSLGCQIQDVELLCLSCQGNIAHCNCIRLQVSSLLPQLLWWSELSFKWRDSVAGLFRDNLDQV